MPNEDGITPEEEVNNTDNVDETLDGDEIDTESEADEAEDSADSDDTPEKETVPLAVHLKLKDKVKALKKDLDSAKDAKAEDGKDTQPTADELSKLAEKYDINEGFVRELSGVINKKTTTEVEQLKKQVSEEKVNQAFNKEFNALADKYPALAEKAEIIKALSFTDQYKNSELEEIALDAFGDLLGKDSSENSKDGSDRGELGKKLDFENLTPEQEAEVMKDPKLKKKLFDYRDSQGI